MYVRVQLDDDALAAVATGSFGSATDAPPRWTAGAVATIRVAPAGTAPLTHAPQVRLVCLGGAVDLEGALDRLEEFFSAQPAPRPGEGVSIEQLARGQIDLMALATAPLLVSDDHPGFGPVAPVETISVDFADDERRLEISVRRVDTGPEPQYAAAATLVAVHEGSPALAATIETGPGPCAWCAFYSVKRALIYDIPMPARRFPTFHEDPKQDEVLSLNQGVNGAVMALYVRRPVREHIDPALSVRRALEALILATK